MEYRYLMLSVLAVCMQQSCAVERYEGAQDREIVFLRKALEDTHKLYSEKQKEAFNLGALTGVVLFGAGMTLTCDDPAKRRTYLGLTVAGASAVAGFAWHCFGKKNKKNE